jgi:gluconolactonase
VERDGKVESFVDNYKGGRFNRPNDVICHSNDCLYFTDPDKRRAYHERDILGVAVLHAYFRLHAAREGAGQSASLV